jgi:hypothetical protein
MIKVNWGCCMRITEQRLTVLEHFQGSLKREKKSSEKNMASMEMMFKNTFPGFYKTHD